MNTFSPKQHFQTFNKDVADILRSNAPQHWMSISLNYALAQIAHSGASSEELNGIRRFIDTFTNLSENEKSLPSFPKKDLETFDRPMPEKNPNQPKPHLREAA